MFGAEREKVVSEAKRAAALAARSWLEQLASASEDPDQFKLGLGSGSTAELFVESLAELPADLRQRLLCVATSKATEQVAKDAGLRLTDLNYLSRLDVTVDGADEIGPELTLVKGGGGALLYEKIVADRSDFIITIADESKVVDALGAFPLPVELIPYGALSTIVEIKEHLAMLGLGEKQVRIRGEDKPFITDSGNVICDICFERIESPEEIDFLLTQIPGVVEHGLFIDLADVAAVGEADGTVRLLAADPDLGDGTLAEMLESNGQGDEDGEDGDGSGRLN